MNTFIGHIRTNKIDFGDYVHYPYGMSKELHIYKVVKGGIKSNFYRDVPDWFHSKDTSHDEVVPCLDIIHCGIDETKVIRVRESDCIKIEPLGVKEV